MKRFYKGIKKPVWFIIIVSIAVVCVSILLFKNDLFFKSYDSAVGAVKEEDINSIIEEASKHEEMEAIRDDSLNVSDVPDDEDTQPLNQEQDTEKRNSPQEVDLSSAEKEHIESPGDKRDTFEEAEDNVEKEQIESVAGLKESIEKYISQFDGKYGIYYINMETGDEFGINDTDEYIAASTSKLPINLYLYKKIEEGEVDPQQILTYKKEDFEAGTGTIQNGSYGDTYTVRETSRLSIEVSDNCGINMIIRLLGIENIRQYMLDLGGTIYYGSRHRSCPKDMALYTKELYRLFENNPEVYGEFIGDLKNTIFNDRINALLPDEIEVAHKIGNYSKTMNDIGIVFARQTYILSVMSENVDVSEALEAIPSISKRIFDFVQSS